MADVKISELSLASAAVDSVVPASDAAGNATSKVTLGSIANLATPAAIGAATADHVHEIANVTGLQTALDGKQAAGNYATADHVHDIANVTGLQAALDGKAVQADIDSSIATLVDSAPETLNTLSELANALGSDANFSTTVTNSLSLKVNSNASAVANSSQITNMVSLTQAEYDALGSTDSSTLYVIQG